MYKSYKFVPYWNLSEEDRRRLNSTKSADPPKAVEEEFEDTYQECFKGKTKRI